MGGAQPGGWLQVEHRKSVRPERSLQMVTVQNDQLSGKSLKAGAGLVIPEASKEPGLRSTNADRATLFLQASPLIRI